MYKQSFKTGKGVGVLHYVKQSTKKDSGVGGGVLHYVQNKMLKRAEIGEKDGCTMI